MAKVKELAKKENIPVAKVTSTNTPKVIDEKLLKQTWNNLESAIRTYNRIFDKYNDNRFQYRRDLVPFQSSEGWCLL